MSKRYTPANGDLVVRKFFRPVILTATGISHSTPEGTKVAFINEEGDEVWEFASELRKRSLYSDVYKVSRLKQRAEAAVNDIIVRQGGIPGVQVAA
jgi:hypothetical protein